MRKKNKFIIEIPIETYATQKEIEEEVKEMVIDYQVSGNLELDRPAPQFDNSKTVVNIQKIKVI